MEAVQGLAALANWLIFFLFRLKKQISLKKQEEEQCSPPAKTNVLKKSTEIEKGEEKKQKEPGEEEEKGFTTDPFVLSYC